ncbi:hypothetical protein [Sphingobacterium sp. SYP-B4668]|uniref:hypothetical protein n=1 Tax=Sphingobacterium sp. SYP-B4668 TaxID=2996035 RepID=UPI0022DE8AD3|nr:hypothetical protein [Sphingobacterium sp. SYP-B4668]
MSEILYPGKPVTRTYIFYKDNVLLGYGVEAEESSIKAVIYTASSSRKMTPCKITIKIFTCCSARCTN